jgi:hypothetical protein
MEKIFHLRLQPLEREIEVPADFETGDCAARGQQAVFQVGGSITNLGGTFKDSTPLFLSRKALLQEGASLLRRVDKVLRWWHR